MAIPPTPKSSFPPSAMPLISPSALLQAYLTQSPPRRPSSRLPSQTRPIHLNISSLTHCNGSALVRLGESTIVCGIRAELLPVTEIAHYRASETSRQLSQSTTEDEQDFSAIPLNNLLVPNLELGTNVHPSYPSNVAPSVTAQSISQRILSLLHSSHLVRVSDLEIRHTPASSSTTELDPDDPAYVEPETNALKAYWVLYIDCVALGYGGESNLFDTAVFAVVAALKDVRLPTARWDEDAKRIFCDADWTKSRRLDLRGLPCPLSFGVFVMDPRLIVEQQDETKTSSAQKHKTNQAVTLVDMDAFEDGVCDERGSVVVDFSNKKSRILRLEKVGGKGSLDAPEIKDVILLAEKRWIEWKKVLDAGLAND